MNSYGIKMLATVPEDLSNCNTEHLIRVFGGISDIPKDAKSLRNSIILSFPSCDSDPRPNWQIPEVRKFIRKLDNDMLHFPYFIHSDFFTCHFHFYMCCLLDFESSNKSVKANEYIDLFTKKCNHIRRFCFKIADNFDLVLNSLSLSLPNEFIKAIPDIRQIVINSLRDLLPKLKLGIERKDIEAPCFGISQDQANSCITEILERAADLIGINTKSFFTSKDLVTELIRKIQ